MNPLSRFLVNQWFLAPFPSQTGFAVPPFVLRLMNESSPVPSRGMMDLRTSFFSNRPRAVVDVILADGMLERSQGRHRLQHRPLSLVPVHSLRPAPNLTYYFTGNRKGPSQGIKPFNRGSVGAQASSSAGVQSSPAMRDSNVYGLLLGQFSSELDSGLTTQLGAGSIWIGFCQHGGALL